MAKRRGKGYVVFCFGRIRFATKQAAKRYARWCAMNGLPVRVKREGI